VTGTTLAQRLIGWIERADARDQVAAMPDLDALLDDHLADGRATWPTVADDPDRYLRQLAAVVARRDTESAERVVRTVPAADLYLAAACAGGDAHAIAVFRDQLLVPLAPHLARLGLPPSVVDETRQRVMEMLFVAAPGGAPQIAGYTGRGRLHSWVRSIAVRTGRRLMGQTAGGDDDLERIPAMSDDPQLEVLRRRYAGSFRDALVAAITGLGERERNLLRQYHIDQLSIDQLAALYRVHRATAARWVIAARAAVLEATRARLVSDLGIDASEVDSIIRLVRSRIDLTLRDLLI
jgi:RNA polymerase sigma-70 factor (ECF subfamily)